jgi:hypothetical protein
MENNRVEVVVDELYLELAEETLATSLNANAEEDDPDMDDFHVERWICPKCKAKELELLPLSKGWRSVRLGCLGILFIPILVVAFNLLIPIRRAEDLVDRLPDWWVYVWIFIIVFLGAGLALAHRQKRCKACGWRSSDLIESQKLPLNNELIRER